MKKTDPRFYNRNLPHWQPENAAFAITFRLAGSLPKEKILQLKAERMLDKEKWTKAHWDNYFQKFDQLLDNPQSGPVWLKETRIAKIVSAALHYRDGKDFRLIAYTIMHNHVHLIVDNLSKVLFRSLQSLKRHTARESNICLGKGEVPFWQKESYDHLIRDEADMQHQITYLLNNPVKAGMVRCWEDHPFTYLKKEFDKYYSSSD